MIITGLVPACSLPTIGSIFAIQISLLKHNKAIRILNGNMAVFTVGKSVLIKVFHINLLLPIIKNQH